MKRVVTYLVRLIGVFAFAWSIVLGGCARIDTATRSATHPGVLHLAEVQDLTTLNPLVSDNADLQDVASLIYGYLLGVDSQGNFTPDLVTEVPSVSNGGLSQDGRTIRYHLRRGVRWQDGIAFDARDVAFSFSAAMNPRNNVPDRSGFDDVIAVRVGGPYEVDVALRRPYSPALATFFSAGANDPYPILPMHLLGSQPDLNHAPYNAQPVGLGPYRVVSWERGSRIVLQADPRFRRGAPKIARVEFAIVPDSNTALTLWQSGALDYLAVRGLGGSRSMLTGARSVAGAREHDSDHYQFNYILFNVSRAPLDEQAVREAIVRGVDRDSIERRVRGELYRPGDGDRLPGQFAYAPALRQAPYDPPGAARLLDAAGWRLHNGVRMRNGTPLSLEIVGVAGSAGSEQFNVQLQAALAKLGIRAQVKTYQYPLLFAPAQSGGIFANGHFDVTNYGWQPGEDADHSYLFRCETRPPNGENYGRICDPAIDRAAALELQSTDPALQASADRDMLRRLESRSYMLFLGFDREILFVRPGLEGLEPSVLGRHFWNIERWSWTGSDK